MNEPPVPQSREPDRLTYAGLLGLAAASVIQLSDKNDLDIPLTVEVYAFAAAIPLLAVGLVMDYARRAGKPIPAWGDLVGVAGAGAAVVGLGGLFFHFGIGPLVVFVAVCILGLILVRRL